MHRNEFLQSPQSHDKQIRLKFNLLEKSRPSNIVMSCYPCFKTSNPQPLKTVQRHSKHRFQR